VEAAVVPLPLGPAPSVRVASVVPHSSPENPLTFRGSPSQAIAWDGTAVGTPWAHPWMR
jgi:hypothetical protein